MRVALIGGGVHPIPPTGYGGTERFIADLSDALVRAGHETVIVNQVRRGRQFDEFSFARALPGLLARERYDVLHANSPVVGNRLAQRGLRFAYTTHSRHWYYRVGLRHRWGYWLERRAVRRATSVVALTPHLARTIENAVRPPLPPLSVIPFGVDGDRFRPAWDRRTGREVLGVGVVLPFKRWEVAAAALRGTGLHLTIVGPTPDPGYARRVRAAGDAVELTGEVSDQELTQRFSTSDVLVHPSQAELLAGAVVQGLSAGLPVLGGPALDGVVDDGTTGWLVPDADLGAFAAGLRARVEALAADPELRRRTGDAARAVAAARFSWPRVVEQYLAVYHAVAGR